MPNRLAQETSPYLRQHADNPVDWYPWGEDALAHARAENKPILLSVGYAACHWCHVMAHESFADPETARLMNELYINVKVDREERPDVDAIYMQAVQAMTGHGGWPMTVFLTPAGEPFWGGTYFPPEERMGIPSFRRVLRVVADAYHQRPDDIAQSVAVMRQLYQTSVHGAPGGTLDRSAFDEAMRAAARAYDQRYGGFGDAPKFPPTMLLEFLLTRWSRTGDEHALAMARSTFANMAAGGIHDQLGGGFHRYSVDERWLVPHFEKMLYDNALLARFGAHLYQATGDASVREVITSLLQWVEREMTSDDGGFYASLDADSEGHEGLYYTWASDEIDAIAGDDAPAVRAWFGVVPEGHIDGRNVLHVNGPLGVAAARAGTTESAVQAALERVRARLIDQRARRARPALDDKVLAGWNGLMLRGVAACARVFGEARWHALASRNATFLWERLVQNGQVMRVWARGEARIPGFLEDHAAVALGFLDVWQLTGERAWFDRARALGRGILDRFWDDALPGFYDVSAEHEALITRPRDLLDNATPSGSSLAIELFLHLATITGEADFARRAEAAIAPLAEQASRHPMAFGHLLCAADMAVNGAVSLVVVGDRTAADDLLEAVRDQFVPALIIASASGGSTDGLALFDGRDSRESAAAAYVCRGTVCDEPVTTRQALAGQLARSYR